MSERECVCEREGGEVGGRERKQSGAVGLGLCVCVFEL